MNSRSLRAAATLLLLLVLAACGRVENTEKPMPGHANVEINRQGMAGAKNDNEGVGVVNHGDGHRESRGSGRGG